MTTFQLVASFLALVGAGGWINRRLLGWPTAAVMVVAGLLSAGLLLLAARYGLGHSVAPLSAIQALNFPEAVTGYMLAFLLFAGAMQVDLSELRRRWLSVWTLATLGVVATMIVVGGGLWGAARLLGLDLSLAWALVFGALISPTDPIAVLAAVRDGKLSKTLEVVLQGEALFNDGVGIVVFTAVLAIALGAGAVHPLATVAAVLIQAIGGLVLGAVAGAVVIRAQRAIDDYAVEVTLTLALAMGVYALAQAVSVSGPIGVVAAGLLVGDRGVRTAMSDTTRRYVQGFWTLVDEILNALLFLLLGLEVLVVQLNARLLGLQAAAIVLVLAARFAVVLPWGVYLRRRLNQPHAGLVLGWGGLHGALSLALALSIPKSPSQSLILSTTFAVVVFSVIVQGLTFERLCRLCSRQTAKAESASPAA